MATISETKPKANDEEKETCFIWIRYSLFLIFGLYIVLMISEMEKKSSLLGIGNETKSTETLVILMFILIILDFLHERSRYDMISFEAKEVIFSLILIVIGLLNKDIRSETWFFGACILLTRAMKKVFETLQYISEHSWRKTEHISKMPKWMQNEYLLSGYRPKMSNYLQALSSIFRIHNQSGNIWSHLIGTAFFAVIAFRHFSFPFCQNGSQDIQV